MKLFIPTCFLILVLSTLAFAQADANFPLVIVVHGIGGGNRDDGWSSKFADAWGVETHEVTYRYEGRTSPLSFVDFAPRAAEWAVDAQRQIKDIIRRNPGRRIMIVSHSWGTVIVKLAFDGGEAKGRYVEPLDLDGMKIEKLVTLASPVGDPKLKAVQVEVDEDRPRLVKDWTNFSDAADRISALSHNLRGATNVVVKGSGNRFDPTGISAHKGIWMHPEVRKHIWNEAVRISNLRGPIERSGPVGPVRFVVWDNANSRALANAQVVLMGANNSPTDNFRASGTSNTDGVVDLQGVVLGAYVVRSRHASCQVFDSGILNLKPNEIHRIVMDCPPVNSTGDRRTPQPATPSPSGSSEEQLVAEYRMLLPLALEKNKKPWHTRVNLVANAVKQGSGYHVNYQAFCLIEQGPDKGKDYPCSEFETVLDLGGIKSAVADMKRQLGR
jgi:pimeloyl-ACP methyl ester carboxylesterase